MRVWAIAAAVLFAGPVWAQAATDGKASVDDYVGSFVEGYVSNLTGPDLGASSFRSIISGVLARGMKPEEQDLFIELASGQPVVVTAPGKVITVPAVDGKVLGIARLFVAPPNLNGLWHGSGEPILQFVEMSRWGRFGKDRVIGFMTNKLFAAWTQSNRANTYTPWNAEFEPVHQAMSSIEDKKVRDEAKLLLKAAVEQVLVKAKEANIKPPQEFQYAFTFLDVGQPAQPQ